MQTVCLRVHQLTLYLGRLQAAACGELSLLFPPPVPRARAGSSPGCRDGGAAGKMDQGKTSQNLAGLLHGGRGKGGAAGLGDGGPQDSPKTGVC